jgi:hypothetical protein
VKHLCTTLYISLAIIYSKYTGARENAFTAGGYADHDDGVATEEDCPPPFWSVKRPAHPYKKRQPTPIRYGKL